MRCNFKYSPYVRLQELWNALRYPVTAVSGPRCKIGIPRKRKSRDSLSTAQFDWKWNNNTRVTIHAKVKKIAIIKSIYLFSLISSQNRWCRWGSEVSTPLFDEDENQCLQQLNTIYSTKANFNLWQKSSPGVLKSLTDSHLPDNKFANNEYAVKHWAWKVFAYTNCVNIVYIINIVYAHERIVS